MWLKLSVVLELNMFWLIPGFKSASDVVKIVRCFRAKPVVAKICPGFKSVPDVVEILRGFRA